MSKFSISEYFVAATQNYYIQATMALAPNSSVTASADALIERMERMNARRKESLEVAVKAAPHHPDADLLKLRETLEAYWWREVEAWIALRKLNTLEAAEFARLARAATAEIVGRIEAIGAVTRDGLEVKARIARWRRFGGSFAAEQDGEFDEAA